MWYLIILAICVVLRGILFVQRGEKFLLTIVPWYNKYVIGRLCEQKKLGIATAISSALFYLILFGNTVIEYLIIDSVSGLTIDTEDPSSINLSEYVPKELLNYNEIIKAAVFISAILYFVLWVILMYKFTVMNDASTWWFIVWGIAPIISYIYFTAVYHTYYTPKEGLISFVTTKAERKERKKKKKKRKDE